MKRIQCTKCKQVSWAELPLDEGLLQDGEWIQIPCPRCKSEWAMVKSGGRTPGGARRKSAKLPTRPKQPAVAPKEKPTTLTPARILSLRKKLGLSQVELGALVGVDRGSVLSWEKGKFKPKAGKAAQLAALATKGKEKVRKLLGEKKAEQEAKPKRPKIRARGPGKKATKLQKK